MPAPKALGPYLTALLDVLRSGPTRPLPQATALGMAEHTTVPELRALFQAWAAHRSTGLTVDEYVFAECDIGEIVPRPSRLDDDAPDPFGDGKVVIGRSPGGDLFVVDLAPAGRKAPVWRVVHDEDWTPYREADSLEAFLRTCAMAVQKDRRENELLTALAKARRVATEGRAKAAAKPARAAAQDAIAWVPAEVPPVTVTDSAAVQALKKRYGTQLVLDASPFPVVVEHGDEGSRVGLARGPELARLDLPAFSDFRCALSPDRTTLVVGSALRLCWIDVATGRVREVPFVGWCCDTAFAADGLLVVATAYGWQEPRRGNDDAVALIARQKDHGGRAWMLSHAELQVFAPDASDAITCVQRITNSAPRIDRVAGRFLVLRSPIGRARESLSQARTWVFVTREHRLVFLAALAKDPGTIVERSGRVFGMDGYELVNLEKAAASVVARPATSLPYDCRTKPGAAPAPLVQPPSVPMRRVTDAPAPPQPVVPEGVDEVSPPAANGVSLGFRATPESGTEVLVVDRAGAPRAIAPWIGGHAIRYAFNADGSHGCVVLISRGAYYVYDIDTAACTARRIEVARQAYTACECLGEFVLLSVSGGPVGSEVECLKASGDAYELAGNVRAWGDTLFSVAGGRWVVTGYRPTATYLNAESVLIGLVAGRPAIVGRLPQGVTRAWDADGRAFVEATDGHTYELPGALA